MADDGDHNAMTELYAGAPTPLEQSAKQCGATGDRYLFEYLMLPMRDGVRLATAVCRPRQPGRHPVLMERTPYRQELPSPHKDIYTRLFAAGYAFVIQSERGTGWSEGDFGFLTNTAADALDTLSWIEQQEWSNGKVATMGCSSTAENQLVLGATGHAALRAQVPMSSGAGIGDIPGAEGNNGLFYRGGVPMLATWVLWHSPFGVIRRPKLPESTDPDEVERLLRNFAVTSPDFREDEYKRAMLKSLMTPPSGDALRRLGVPGSGFDTYITAGPADEVWEKPDLIRADHTGATPALNVNGWMDVGAYETVKLYEFQQHHPEQYLIMAPSRHCAMVADAGAQAWLGDRPMGDTRFPYADVITSWFDRFLQDGESAWKPMPRVQAFLMGAGCWLTGDSWPLPETEVVTRYLHSAGGANTLWGDGLLVDRPVSYGTPLDRFLADPANPVPTLGGGLALGTPVCVDQRPVECRSDVLVYSAPAEPSGEAVVGDVEATLYVSTNVEDTDVHLKLVDVHPSGEVFNLAETCLRLRYRDGYARPSPLERDRIYEITLKGMTTANYFGPGHRIRIEVAGSNFPLCDRNWNTGGRNEEESAGPIAEITLHHSEDHPSRITYRRYTRPVPPVTARG